MSRYIDADVLHKAYMELRNFKQDPQSGDWISLRAVPLTTVIRMLNEASAIDAVEVVRGEWVYCEDYVGQDGYKCSECGFFAPWHYNVYDIDYISDYHYCPNCGAKMKGADDERR